ncbi:hypothetical protein O4H61_18890 [Roseovarius aestuarii]|nr:hypothetical protein [Roseovarius aestuarii]
MAMSMTQMGQDPAFERFLAAPVGEDRTGTSVSVLSMLARLNVDPWIEAADLAKMQEAPARQRLVALLARFEDVPTLLPDQGRVASGLLAFLPNRAKTTGPSESGSVAQSVKLPTGAPVYWIIAAALFLVWIWRLAHGS